MNSVLAGDLFRLPVKTNGIEIGRPVDLIVDPARNRALGFDVLCRDESHRFLPLTAAVFDARADRRRVGARVARGRPARLLPRTCAIAPRARAGSRRRVRRCGRHARGRLARRRLATRGGRRPRAPRAAQLGPARRSSASSARAATSSTSPSTRRCSSGPGCTTSALRSSRSSWPSRTTTGGTGTGRSAGSAAISRTRGCASSSSRASRSARTSSSCACSSRSASARSLAQAIAIVLVTPLNFVGNKLWSFRAPSIRLTSVRRLVVAVALFLSVAARRSAATSADRRRSSTRRGASSRRRSRRPQQPAVLTDERAIAIFLAYPKVKDWLTRYPTSGRTDRRAVQQGLSLLAGQRLVGQGRRDRDGPRRRRVGEGHGGVDRAAGRVEDGARLRRRVRRQEDQQLPASGSASARSSCSASSTGAGRSRCATSTCSRCSRSPSRCGSSTTATIFASAPLAYPPLRLPDRPRPLDRAHRTRVARTDACGRCGFCSRRPRSSRASA